MDEFPLLPRFRIYPLYQGLVDGAIGDDAARLCCDVFAVRYRKLPAGSRDGPLGGRLTLAGMDAHPRCRRDAALKLKAGILGASQSLSDP